jgi:predicted DNA-binding transcriptional regulator AlpA
MNAIGSLAALAAVARTIGARTSADKRQIIDTVREAIGWTDETAQESGTPTDTILRLPEAAARLGRSVSTIKYYAATGTLTGVRTGPTQKLTGIPASQIDAFIRRHTQPQPEQTPTPEATPA